VFSGMTQSPNLIRFFVRRVVPSRTARAQQFPDRGLP
jgi:hypothetical protein